MESPLEVCILAAGLGKRLKSDKPKALAPLAGRPMLAHLLDSVAALGAMRTHVVVGRGAEAVKAAFADRGVNFVKQEEQLGTGHAVMQALPHVSDGARLLVLLGDAPLVTVATLERLVAADCALGVLSVDLPDPFGYGRIVRGDDGQVEAIVEERDASEAQRRIREINTGVMVGDASRIRGWLDETGRDNDQGEYLLTDIIRIAAAGGHKVKAVKSRAPGEVQGVNTLVQLAALEREYQRRQAECLMEAGVQLMDPARFDVRGTLDAGRGCRIDVNCVFEGECRLGNDVVIGPNCLVRDCTIGDGTEVRANSVVDGATIAANCTVGPFARIRPGTRLADSVSVGNFVEVKNAELDEGTKASHLSYLGDATIGAGVNIGAGTITCNYDGVNKHRTEIGDGVFVGSNTALVAPVTIGERSTIGAGSTITQGTPPDSLAVARGRQKNIENWKKPEKN